MGATRSRVASGSGRRGLLDERYALVDGPARSRWLRHGITTDIYAQPARERGFLSGTTTDAAKLPMGDPEADGLKKPISHPITTAHSHVFLCRLSARMARRPTFDEATTQALKELWQSADPATLEQLQRCQAADLPDHQDEVVYRKFQAAVAARAAEIFADQCAAMEPLAADETSTDDHQLTFLQPRRDLHRLQEQAASTEMQQERFRAFAEAFVTVDELLAARGQPATTPHEQQALVEDNPSLAHLAASPHRLLVDVLALRGDRRP